MASSSSRPHFADPWDLWTALDDILEELADPWALEEEDDAGDCPSYPSTPSTYTPLAQLRTDPVCPQLRYRGPAAPEMEALLAAVDALPQPPTTRPCRWARLTEFRPSAFVLERRYCKRFSCRLCRRMKLDRHRTVADYFLRRHLGPLYAGVPEVLWPSVQRHWRRAGYLFPNYLAFPLHSPVPAVGIDDRHRLVIATAPFRGSSSVSVDLALDLVELALLRFPTAGGVKVTASAGLFGWNYRAYLVATGQADVDDREPAPAHLDAEDRTIFGPDTDPAVVATAWRHDFSADDTPPKMTPLDVILASDPDGLEVVKRPPEGWAGTVIAGDREWVHHLIDATLARLSRSRQNVPPGRPTAGSRGTTRAEILAQK